MSLAFGTHEPVPSQKEVFAFLPVRRYGLNFIVQVRAVLPVCAFGLTGHVSATCTIPAAQKPLGTMKEVWQFTFGCLETCVPMR